MSARRSLKGLSDADVAALQRLVDGQVDENLGMPMIYTIVAAAQEWLRDKVCGGALRRTLCTLRQHLWEALGRPGQAKWKRATAVSCRLV